MYNDYVSQKFIVEGSRANLSIDCKYGPYFCTQYAETFRNATYMVIDLSLNKRNVMNNAVILLEIRNNVTLAELVTYRQTVTTVIPSKG